MDFLRLPCNSCTSLYRQLSSPKAYNHRFSSLKCRRQKTTSELQTQTGRAGNNNNNFSPSIPTHKVTVHDTQRGVVHEFFVPEVPKSAKNIENVELCYNQYASVWLTRIIPVFFFFFFWESRTSIYCTQLNLRISRFHLLAGTVLFSKQWNDNVNAVAKLTL